MGLTSKQLLAARVLVKGGNSDLVAQRLKTTRQTINRWKKKPAFVAEMKRLHEALLHGVAAVPPVSPAPARSSSATPLPKRLSERDLDKEFDEFIARMRKR